VSVSIRVTGVDTRTSGKRITITVPDRFVVEVEPDVQVALPLDVARELRDRLVDAIDQLQGTRWFR
jgi:hypothetical protein